MPITIEDYQIAALIITPITLLGTFANWTVFILSFKSKTFVHSFGRLTAAQSLGDALHSTVFLFGFVPMVFLNNKFMIDNSHHLGHFLVLAYDISTYLHLCISANRFCALVFPFRYQDIFNLKFTYFLIALCYCISIFPSFKLYGREDCQVYIMENVWLFVFSPTPICQKITWYAVFLKDTFIVVSVAILDLFTVINVRMANQKISQRNNSQGRRNIEINFLKQACCQAVVFVCEHTSIYSI